MPATPSTLLFDKHAKQPTPEERRQRLAEAAERRLKSNKDNQTTSSIPSPKSSPKKP